MANILKKIGEMINLNGIEYQNWQDYFKKVFAQSLKYDRFSEKINDQAELEKYTPKDANNKTEIRIAYLDETLIYWRFENPNTAGYNRQQEIEHFYQYDFTPNQSYGNPGLEFNKTNLKVIDKQLKFGIRGKEVQYFKNEKLLKSKIYINYEGKETKYPNIIFFEKRNFIEKLIQLFRKENNSELTKKEINLLDIFSGI
ncbi:hypothetical protein HNQ02_003882 [Flavobacterium sp. 7E]|uniref:hypothetical protein n=1 Tax=Flavobacterium sp. 7E TaxID=2735898 RepID=UPI00156D4B6E|nr:hypothetical protein [Flavobacterium sp. 7E]NRS90927.1 hypothetical protein [Flavobacterium sp. 7E]